MDVLKEYENFERRPSRREEQEIARITRKENQYKYPYKNSCKKSIGEYFPSLEDKITELKYLMDHPTLPEADRKYIKEHYK